MLITSLSREEGLKSSLLKLHFRRLTSLTYLGIASSRLLFPNLEDLHVLLHHLFFHHFSRDKQQKASHSSLMGRKSKTALLSDATLSTNLSLRLHWNDPIPIHISKTTTILRRLLRSFTTSSRWRQACRMLQAFSNLWLQVDDLDGSASAKRYRLSAQVISYFRLVIISSGPRIMSPRIELWKDGNVSGIWLNFVGLRFVASYSWFAVRGGCQVCHYVSRHISLCFAWSLSVSLMSFPILLSSVKVVKPCRSA